MPRRAAPPTGPVAGRPGSLASWPTSSIWTGSARATAPPVSCSTDVSLGLDDDDRVGVVGLNGAGKSTLLRLLAKAEEPDSGRVTHRRDLRVAALPQTLDLAADATVRDVVLGTAWLPEGFGAEHEWAGDAGVRTVLDGLGMPHLGLDAAGRADVRRRAAPGRAGRAAGPRRPTC